MVWGQEGYIPDIKKPKQFENRVLRSEKSDDKKFSFPRRVMQNTITHYNYYYNASLKLQDILTRAKESFRDDLSQLLPFYNYSLDATAADSLQIDSLSYKSQSAIVLHDVRNDWADNMYLLWAQAYFLKKQFDSSALMLQFINYAFAEKEDDGYYKMIGSARDGNSAASISSKEKKGLFSKTSSRNDAFAWRIRTHIERNQYADAGALLLTLKDDPAFPARLHDDLEELQAYSFYRRQMWDSAALHLEQALSNAPTRQEKARWEYLIGQLYERTGRHEQALSYFDKVISHTSDPVMEVYARLASVRVTKQEGNDNSSENIATLLRMARRDKYTDYRDIIYYMAAQMELERDSTAAAMAWLKKSTQYASNNLAQRNKAFLQLAELSFQYKKYPESLSFYDSLRLEDAALLVKMDEIGSRKEMLGRLIQQLSIIQRQDSLQQIAAMPEEERVALVRKKVSALRKQQGLKEEKETITTSIPRAEDLAPNLFNDNKKGEWYFYNNTLKQKGYSDFKSRWGSRPNTDNWRRSSALVSGNTRRDHLQGNTSATPGDEDPGEINFETLYARLPLTPDKMQQSNDSLKAALFNSGKIYVQELEDCESGTSALERVRSNFDDHPNMDEVLFNLYLCYNKNGKAGKASEIKNLLSTKYPGSSHTAIVVSGKNPEGEHIIPEATKAYEKVYDLFLEGKFDEARELKKTADQQYGSHHWTPQLLYIESVYHIRKREDSIAKEALQNILSRFPDHAIGAKASILLNVLNRRDAIEEELRNLVIVMPAADTNQQKETAGAEQEDALKRRTQPRFTDASKAIVTGTEKDKTKIGAPDSKVPEKEQAVAIQKPVLAPGKEIQKEVPDKKDSIPPVAAIPETKKDTAAAVVKPPATETVKPQAAPDAYHYDAAAPHYVMIVLTKVDPIFVNEARNAFFRYNKDQYYNKQMKADLVQLDNDNHLLLISPFSNAAEAVAYIDQTKPRTASEIVPWLTGGKYSYSIVSERNLKLLQEKKNAEEYKKFLQQQVPGKF